MRKEIRTVTRDGIVQVTIADERFYGRATTDPVTGLPGGFEWVPAVTWISSFFPKGIGFYKWLANTGWDEARAIKQAAGDKGSKVHHAVGDLIDGKTVAMDAAYVNNSTGQEESLTLEEYDCLLAFKAWWETVAPVKVIAREVVLWNDEYGYAGTADLLCGIKDDLFLIDLKTGQHLWPEHILQVSAYKHALPEAWAAEKAKLAILQVGYRANKRGWKFSEVPDEFPLFLAARQIWEKECEGVTVFKRDYPLAIALGPTATPSEAAP